MPKRRYDKAAKRETASEATRRRKLAERRPPRKPRYFKDGVLDASEALYRYQSMMAGPNASRVDLARPMAPRQ